MNATRKVKLKDISSNLTCKLCLGYLIDATTIIECLHSFCKACIVKYLEKSADLEEKYCPVCDVQLHSTKPLTSIRSDLMLQEIVYKLVPGLFKREMLRRRSFYDETPTSAPSNQLDSGQVLDELYITSDDLMHLSLEYVTDNKILKESTRRFLKCPAAVSVHVLKKFIQGKYDLPLDTDIDVMFGERVLPDDFLLMDIAYKYSWTMNGNKPLNLRYCIKEYNTRRPILRPNKTINESLKNETPLKTTEDELVSPVSNIKKVCNENGNNIMPSEEIKSNLIKLNGNGLINGEITIGPIKTPHGKVRGRKRKLLNYQQNVIERNGNLSNLSKRMKLPKQENTSQTYSTQTIQQSESEPCKKSNPEIQEVQLQISENGVMSACSGKEKFILKTELSVSTASTSTTNNISIPSPTTSNTSNAAEKLLLSGNFHSKMSPSGVTEIICDKPDPSSGPCKPSIAKPGYVTLNIPNPGNPIFSQSISNSSGPDRYEKITNSVQNKSSVPLQNGKVLPKNTMQTGQQQNFNHHKIKSSTMEKIKSRIIAKGKDGENVKKAMNDLAKLSSHGGDNNNSVNLGSVNQSQKSIGMHSLPIATSFSSSTIHRPIRPKPPNGTIINNGNPAAYNGLPLGLNFSPNSGMSVSMIPCEGTISDSKSTGTLNNNASQPSSKSPPKRPHQTTNGDLNFSSTTLGEDNSPKKIPKFFKSRHAATPAANNSHTSKKQQGGIQDTKRKTPVKNVNGINESKKATQSPKVKQSNTGTFKSADSPGNLGAQMSTSSLTGGVNGGFLYSAPKLSVNTTASTEQYAQHLNNLANGSLNTLNSTFGISAATTGMPNGNGLHNASTLGMVPFVTNSFCSLPFFNPRHTTIQQLPQLGFGFEYQNQAQAVTAQYIMNLQKAISNKSVVDTSPATSNSQVVNSETIEKKKETNSLDLTVPRSAASNGNGTNNESEKPTSAPLLVNLLNNCKKSPDNGSTTKGCNNDEKIKVISPTNCPTLHDSKSNNMDTKSGKNSSCGESSDRTPEGGICQTGESKTITNPEGDQINKSNTLDDKPISPSNKEKTSKEAIKSVDPKNTLDSPSSPLPQNNNNNRTTIDNADKGDVGKSISPNSFTKILNNSEKNQKQCANKKIDSNASMVLNNSEISPKSGSA